VKAIIGKLCFAETKSKVINPNASGNSLNCAGWEMIVNSWVDAEYIVNQIYDYDKKYIINATAKGFTEDEISQDLNCSQPNINKKKYTINRLIRRLQNG
jgi:hypothetical protein